MGLCQSQGSDPEWAIAMGHRMHTLYGLLHRRDNSSAAIWAQMELWSNVDHLHLVDQHLADLELEL